MNFGIDRFIENANIRKPLLNKRIALLAHPASVTRDLIHSLDALAALPDVTLAAAFGPQHGLRGDKQDNMIESLDFHDPVHGIPVFSLYGDVRRPTAAMMDSFDVLLVDLQDIGCRIYTFITTVRYMLEAAAQHNKVVWILDRPKPVARRGTAAARATVPRAWRARWIGARASRVGPRRDHTPIDPIRSDVVGGSPVRLVGARPAWCNARAGACPVLRPHCRRED